MAAVLEHGYAVPAPVHAVVLDEAVADLHHLHQVHLLAVRAVPRVLPAEPGAVGEITSPEPLAFWWLVREDLGHERPQFGVAANDPEVGAEQVAYQRALQRGVRLVER